MSDSKHEFPPLRTRRGSSHSPRPPSDPEQEIIPIQPIDVVPEPEPAEPAAFPFDAEPTDDSPTIISKTVPQVVEEHEEEEDGFEGLTLAHFDLIQKVGAGGMAAVLKARDRQLDRFVALKILPPDLAGDTENIRRFHQEARSAAKLDHENVARVFFCGEDQTLHFIAFEFVDGDNLRQILERDGPLDYRLALNYLIQITAGLCHAAQRGVVHRDIKPSNIIITPEGRAKLVDMGLARIREATVEDDLTKSGVTLGTLDYVSPEQAIAPKNADVRSDIYSLGCTFYHMLTGKPPVPEGTAARKLHYHQHVRPTDPRAIVVGLPDEIAGLLDRMLAKKPGERFQTAQDLLSHLGALSKKFHKGDPKKSEVGLVIETRTPPPARTRLSVIGLAVATLAVICLVLSAHRIVPDNTIPEGAHRVETSPETPGHGVRADRRPPITPTTPDPKNPGQLPPVGFAAVYDSSVEVRPLADWLAENEDAQKLEIVLDRDLVLKISKDTPDPGIVLKASEKVTFRAKDPSIRPTLKIVYDGDPPPSTPWTALTIESPTSHVEGIRIVIDANQSRADLVGLRYKGGESHRVQRCDFFQTLAGRTMTSVIVESEKNPRTVPTVSFNECCWLGFEDSRSFPIQGEPTGQTLEFQGVARGGRDAVHCEGPTDLRFTHCMMGPHRVAVRLHGDGQNAVYLDHCSFLLDGPTTVFRLEGDVRTILDVKHSLFSAPKNESAPLGIPLVGGERGPVLVQRTSTRSKATYQGHDNRYHQLAHFWIEDEGKNSKVAVEMDRFARELVTNSLGNDDSRAITTSPWWAEKPLDRLNSVAIDIYPDRSRVSGTGQEPLEEQQIVQAFQIDDRLRELRQSDSRKDHLIGAERRGTHSYVANLPQLSEVPLANLEKKYVDPSDPDPSNGIYANLESAVLAAEPGDTILIRHNGLLEVRPIALENKATNLTIRPDLGSKPILTMGETRASKPSMFTLHDGKLELSGLQFLLRPKEEEFTSQSLVAVLGQGSCSLSSCVVTLDPDGQSTALSVGEHLLARGLMRPGPKKPESKSPRLVFNGTFVRGKGDLLRSNSGEPLDVEASNCLFALEGSLLYVRSVPPPALEEPIEDAPTFLPDAPPPTITLQFERVTTWLGKHLLHLKAGKELVGLPVVSIQPTECLFLAHPKADSFVHLESPPGENLSASENVVWQPGRNFYGSWSSLFDRKGMNMEMPVNLEQWKKFTGEIFTGDLGSKYREKLTEAPPEGPFSKLLPSHFNKMDTGVGANASHLPRPAGGGE